MHLILHSFLTLDGVMQGPGGAEEDPSGGFTRGGWLVPFAAADTGTIVGSWFERADAVLLGRTTYELMESYWPQVTDPANGVARVLNGGKKYVVSTTLREASWGDTTVLDSLDPVRALKAQDGGELQVHGSAGLATALHAAGLVDEYRLLTVPVTVGAGKRFFTADAPASGYDVVEQRITSSGGFYSVLRPKPFDQGVYTVLDDGTESH